MNKFYTIIQNKKYAYVIGYSRCVSFNCATATVLNKLYTNYWLNIKARLAHLKQ